MSEDPTVTRHKEGDCEFEVSLEYAESEVSLGNTARTLS